MQIRQHVNVAPAGETVVSREAPDRPPAMPAAAVGRTGGSSSGPFGLSAGWWPVAFSSEIGPSPRSVRLGARDLVCYRDQTGSARALADRCPHRRLPLSMGRVVQEGLQCGYHGWTFDGATGRCSLIPDFSCAGEKPSERIRVSAYQVRETDGFTFVWTGSGPPQPLALPLPTVGVPAKPFQDKGIRGMAEARAPHAAVAEALLVNPGAALGLGWLLGGGDEVLGPEVTVEASSVVVRRHRLRWNLPRVATFDPVNSRVTGARVATIPATGMTVAVPETPVCGEVRIVVGLTSTAPYRTTVRWRIEATGSVPLTRQVCRWMGMTGRLTGRVARALEAAADATETVSDPAIDRLRELRVNAAGEETS